MNRGEKIKFLYILYIYIIFYKKKEAFNIKYNYVNFNFIQINNFLFENFFHLK